MTPSVSALVAGTGHVQRHVAPGICAFLHFRSDVPITQCLSSGAVLQVIYPFRFCESLHVGGVLAGRIAQYNLNSSSLSRASGRSFRIELYLGIPYPTLMPDHVRSRGGLNMLPLSIQRTSRDRQKIKPSYGTHYIDDCIVSRSILGASTLSLPVFATWCIVHVRKILSRSSLPSAQYHSSISPAYMTMYSCARK